MYGVPQAGLTVPAVAGQLERGVRPHRAIATFMQLAATAVAATAAVGILLG
jgi:hypothetical protein